MPILYFGIQHSMWIVNFIAEECFLLFPSQWEIVLQFDEGGLGLPARNYYLNESDKDVVDAYVEYITRVSRILVIAWNLIFFHDFSVIQFTDI